MRSLSTLVACAATLISLPTCLASAIPDHGIERRDVPESAYFDLTKPSYDLFRDKLLHQITVQQSFTFDNTNRRLFVVQRPDGTPVEQGDLCITELDFEGNELGHMYVLGAGHGVAIGAEAEGDDTYLWTEADCQSNGYGNRLARFKYVNGKTLNSDSDDLAKFKPFEDDGNFIATINPVDNTLVTRFAAGDTRRIAAFPVAEASKNNWTSVYDFEQPALEGMSNVFQGYAAYGSYFYMLSGTSNDSNGGSLNSEVTAVNVNTGKISQGPTLTKAGKSLTYREPEGMAVYTTKDGEPRLFLGFASGGAGDRRCSIFYKNELVKS